MPKMLTMSNGRPETILSSRDFEDLIDKYMGSECANHYHEQIEQLSECIRELSSYINDSAIAEEIEEVLKIDGY